MPVIEKPAVMPGLMIKNAALSVFPKQRRNRGKKKNISEKASQTEMV